MQLLPHYFTLRSWIIRFDNIGQGKQLLLGIDSFSLVLLHVVKTNVSDPACPVNQFAARRWQQFLTLLHLDVAASWLKRVLNHLAAHTCYITAGITPRKDIQTASGFLDIKMTLSAKARMAAMPNPGFSCPFRWESAVAGCTLTADRLAAAGLVDSPACRFCRLAKESVKHIAFERTALPPDPQRPWSQFFSGPNFALLLALWSFLSL